MLFSAGQDRDLQARVQLVTRVNKNDNWCLQEKQNCLYRILFARFLYIRFVLYNRLTMFYPRLTSKWTQPKGPSFWETIVSFIWITCYHLIVLNRLSSRATLSQLSMLALMVSDINLYPNQLFPNSCSCKIGFNITVIAYGQTGSGKTFTIFGPGLLYTMNESDFGMVPRTVRNLFYKAKVKNLLHLV